MTIINNMIEIWTGLEGGGGSGGYTVAFPEFLDVQSRTTV
jgi:hypothetical protein